MSSKDLYVKGARVWIPNAEWVWEGAVVEDDYKPNDNKVVVRTEKGVLHEVKLKSEADLPHLRNPTILIGQNDLTALSYLHEPDVLYNLEVRFKERNVIYTYCGIILVAINPYHDLPIYGNDIVQAYRGHSMGELEPHIFAISEEAYAKLEREKSNISIIVSGESGAGKTVSAKYAMRYFAAVGGSESETQIEQKVLASSPIMEAIGNAKTTRNDNSSRFGKFTKLLFSNELSVMMLTGASMVTYLLEKSRVVFQATGERNYHIFYQLCAGRDKYPELMLDHQDKFRFLNQGQSPTIEKVSDADEFKETLQALSTLGFKKPEIDSIMRILAGILHLGNIVIEESDQETCTISGSDLSMNVLSEILKLNKNNLAQWLTTRQIESFNDTVMIPMNKATAEAARDALAKHLYSKLFMFIVQTINRNLVSGKKEDGFIGVLDIYGFETFDCNSFEQFSINYANEKLQQQFNQHVFKLEQEEYLKEGIVWTMIDFYDNQPCIDLIEAKLGILDLLDEECRMPNGSDASWLAKLNEKCTKYKHYDKPRFGNLAFLVKHFSDTVQYECRGFLEKNRDTVSKELVSVIEDSEMDFCRHVIALDEKEHSDEPKKPHNDVKVVISASKAQTNAQEKRAKTLPSKQHKKTVGSQFRESLTQLIATLHSTTPHYVRCIKPNEDKKSFKWEAGKIVQQLRACGVLETVRISAAGFPSRWLYDDFYERYRLLCKRAEIVDWNVKATCTNIVRNRLDDDKYREGHTQIFFRAGQVAYLEVLRADLRRRYIIKVQSVIRRFICRRRYLKIQKTVLGIQTYARGLLARRKIILMRQNAAATTIQRYMRGWFHRKRYVQAKRSALAIQRYGRGFITRRKYAEELKNYKVTVIQRYCRGYLARKRYNEKIKKIVKVQSCIRRFLAKKKFRALKAEARSISHLQTKYKGLENKIIELQQKVDVTTKENTSLKTQNAHIPELRRKLETAKIIEIELKTMKTTLSDKEDRLIAVQKSLDRERDEKMALIEENTKEADEWMAEKTQWLAERRELEQRIAELTEMNQRTALHAEEEANLAKVLAEKDSLENENANLKQEIKRLQLIISSPQEIDHLKSNLFSNDEDFGYSSSRNTLEKHHKHKSSLHLSEGEFFSMPGSAVQNNSSSSGFERKLKSLFGFSNRGEQVTSTPNNSSSASQDTTVLMLRLRKLLEEEKNKGDVLREEVVSLKSKSSVTMNAEESIKVSELEVENERLREDYELLRYSIKRGVEQQELDAQYSALVEESKRRRDECIQLRSILSQQSQNHGDHREISYRQYEGNEMMEVLQAQKSANKQLESELQALTEEHNKRLTEFMKEVDALRNEKCMLESLIQDDVQGDSKSDSKERYLRIEVERTTAAYVDAQEQLGEFRRIIQELQKQNNVLKNRLKQNGMANSILFTEEELGSELANVMKKKSKSYQGILKHQQADEAKILQRLVTDLTPRTAITLTPSLPAYILLMCIRYTDLLNADDHVRTLLSNFILAVKKFYKVPNKIETRILWIVNSITLHNLLKQYGGMDKYMKFNTDQQNQQQLKNFDLSEYCTVIEQAIDTNYKHLVKQMQDSMKNLIVPAILYHDETARGKIRRAKSAESPEKATSEPQSLIDQLEHFYKQFIFFGLQDCYIEQIFQQLFYFICAVALNNLMLRRDLCTWKTGMKLKFNVGCLENWVKQRKMSEAVITPSSSLTEAALLMQSRKSDADVDSICEICPTLSPAQVLKLIRSYTSDDCEDTVSPKFIEKLTKKLGSPENESFTMNENEIRPLKVVFKYSDTKLEDVEVPDVLKLHGIVTRI